MVNASGSSVASGLAAAAVVALLGLSTVLAGCGQKGPLTLPTTPAATAASAPAGVR
jgi:predicted small lipoprotein YifL